VFSDPISIKYYSNKYFLARDFSYFLRIFYENFFTRKLTVRHLKKFAHFLENRYISKKPNTMITIISTNSTALTNAKRFDLSEDIFPYAIQASSSIESSAHPVIEAAFFLNDVFKIHANGHHLTIFAKTTTDWDSLTRGLRRILIAYNPPSADHLPADNWRAELTTEKNKLLSEIQSALDATVRPALQKDAGDIEISFFDGEKIKLKYQGTCRSCGFSTTSTLEFIQKSLFVVAPHVLIEVS
jgi:Fe-S cluster biogenesis protein NfuA